MIPLRRISLWTVVAALALPGVARADRSRLTGGPVVGLNIAGMSGDARLDLYDTSSRARLVARERVAAGGFATLRLHPRLSLRAELLYAMKGAKADGADRADPTTFYELRYSSSYLAVPVLVSYDIEYGGEFTPRLFAGPEIDVRLGSELTGAAGAPDMDGMPQMFAVDEDLEADSRGVDLAVVVGAGMGFPVGSGALVIDIRYVQGVTGAIDEHEVTPMQGVSLRAGPLRHRVFALVASYEL